jgi:gluconate 2-dehydrogenase gamma chain
MSEHDETRRKFLTHVAVGAGAVAGAGFVPDALAQATPQHERHTMPQHPQAGTMSMSHEGGEGRGAFFNATDAETVAAITERIMPDAPGKPGAREAGVLNYIDLALAGAYSDLQDFYRRGLASLDAYCRKTHNAAFARLDAAKQDEVLIAVEEGKATEFSWPSAPEFFNTVRIHTMEGMFADPLYGGNKDFSGWRLVDFPGAQAVFTPGDLKSTQTFSREPIIGLQSESKMSERRS